LLVAAYWRTNLTMRQLGPLSGISKSAADRVIDHIAPLLALAPVRRRHPADTVLIVDGTLVPTRDRGVAASSKNYRYSTNHQVGIDANTRLVVAAGRPLPGNRHDARAYRESGVAGGQVQIQAAVHIQLEPSVRIHVRPEQWGERAPVRVGEGVGHFGWARTCCISSVLTWTRADWSRCSASMLTSWDSLSAPARSPSLP